MDFLARCRPGKLSDSDTGRASTRAAPHSALCCPSPSAPVRRVPPRFSLSGGRQRQGGSCERPLPRTLGSRAPTQRAAPSARNPRSPWRAQGSPGRPRMAGQGDSGCDRPEQKSLLQLLLPHLILQMEPTRNLTSLNCRQRGSFRRRRKRRRALWNGGLPGS